MTMPPGFDRLQIGLQRGRVHRDQRIDFIARRENVGAGKVNLIPADARQRAGGARISAGKSGSVLMSLPISAEVSVNCVPASCIPSPLSPQNRTVTDGSVVTGLRRPSAGLDVGSIVRVMEFSLRTRRVGVALAPGSRISCKPY